MKPTVLGMFGVACLAFSLAGKELWQWAPTVGWMLTVFFFSAAFFTSLKNRK